MNRVLHVVACALAFPSVASAQCGSRADTTPVEYLEYRDGRYTICYSPDYPDDLDFVDEWLSRAFDLGVEKYGVVSPTYGGDPFYLTVYLPGAATASTSQGFVRMACCYPNDDGTVHAEIHYLKLSAWEGDVLGGLGRPPEYYHPHYITHETVHFFQWACCRTGARNEGYRWPAWLIEGMAESDGYRHTTEYGRTTSQLFDDLVADLADDVPPPTSDYTPQMACTGRYWTSTAGLSFEVRILNNERRPAAHNVFQQQYRRNASRPWTTNRSLALVLPEWDRSGYSTPLFTSTSSPSFQWRARSRPMGQTTDTACSNWSNTIDWTVAQCAAERVGQ